MNGTLRANGANGGPPRTDRQPLVVANTLKGQRGKGGGGIGPEETLIAGALTSSVAQLDDQDTTRLVAFHQTQDPISEHDMAPAIGRTSIGMGVASRARGVRRLTPLECERLMGWADHWTAPPGLTAPDGRRYAACGDGVVANVAEWIGIGIREVDSDRS